MNDTIPGTCILTSSFDEQARRADNAAWLEPDPELEAELSDIRARVAS